MESLQSGAGVYGDFPPSKKSSSSPFAARQHRDSARAWKAAVQRCCNTHAGWETPGSQAQRLKHISQELDASLLSQRPPPDRKPGEWATANAWERRGVSCRRSHIDERIQARGSGHSPVSGAFGTNSPSLPGGMTPAAPAGTGWGAVHCGRRGQGRRLEERREEARRKPKARSPHPHPAAWRAARGPRKLQLKWRHASCLSFALTSAPGGLLVRPSPPTSRVARRTCTWRRARGAPRGRTAPPTPLKLAQGEHEISLSTPQTSKTLSPLGLTPPSPSPAAPKY